MLKQAAIKKNRLRLYRMATFKSTMCARAREYHKIFRAIVISLAVYMVNNLMPIQAASHRALCGEAMFKDIAAPLGSRIVMREDLNVTAMCDDPSASPHLIFRPAMSGPQLGLRFWGHRLSSMRIFSPRNSAAMLHPRFKASLFSSIIFSVSFGQLFGASSNSVFYSKIRDRSKTDLEQIPNFRIGLVLSEAQPGQFFPTQYRGAITFLGNIGQFFPGFFRMMIPSVAHFRSPVNNSIHQLILGVNTQATDGRKLFRINSLGGITCPDIL